MSFSVVRMELWFSEGRNGGRDNPHGFSDYEPITVLSSAERAFTRGAIDGTIPPTAYMIMPDRPMSGVLSRTMSHLHRHPMFVPLFSFLWEQQQTEFVIDKNGDCTIFNKYRPYQTFYTKAPDHWIMMLSNVTVSTTDSTYTLIESPPITMNRIALFLPANVLVRVRYELVWKNNRVFVVADMDQGHLLRYNMYDAEYVNFLTPKEEFAYRLKNKCGV